MGGVNLDSNGRGVRAEEVLVDLEDEPVVPRGISLAVVVYTGGELPVGVDPGDGVGADGAGYMGKVLCGDDVQLQELERVQDHRHLLPPSPTTTQDPKIKK